MLTFIIILFFYETFMSGIISVTAHRMATNEDKSVNAFHMCGYFLFMFFFAQAVLIKVSVWLGLISIL